MNKAGTYFVPLAALCWGVAGGIGGILISRGWDPLVVSFYRGAIGLLFVSVWLIRHPQGHGFRSGRMWLASAGAGLGVAGNFAFYFISISEGSVAVAATLMYSAPAFVYLVSFAFRFERPTRLKGVSLALVMLGILLLTRIHNIEAERISVTGLAAGLMAGLSYAGFIFAFKIAARHGSPQAVLVIAFSVMSAILIGPGDPAQRFGVLSTSTWPFVVILGVLGAGIPFILYVVGLKYTPPATASIAAMIEPVTATLFGILILGEKLVGTQLIGMGLIVTAVSILSVPSKTGRPA